MKEKLQTRQMWKWLLVIAVLLAGVLGMSVHAQAATRKYPPELKAGKTYSIKLTGSRTYKVKWTNKYDSKKGGTYVNLYIDNKKVKMIKNELGNAYAHVLKVGKNRNLIALDMYTYVGEIMQSNLEIYEYKNGQFKLLLRDDNRKGKYRRFSAPYNVGNNQFTMDYGYSWFDEKSWTRWESRITYKVGADKITKAGSIFPVERYKVIVARKITAYKTADSKDVMFTVQEDSKIILLKVAEIKGATYLKIRNDKGKEGWFKVSNKVGYFKN